MTTADDLLAVAAEGVDFDGLCVVETDGGYRFEVPGERHEGLPAAAVRELAAEHADYVTNWRYWEREVGSRDAARREFLRWLEDAPETGDEPGLPVPERYAALADGVTREWGQLAVTTTLNDGGERRYSIRHVAEADADPGGLECYDDPLAARELVKTDDRGRYRPLKTAPTLPTGWAFPDLDGDGLVRAVDFVYPATVANWYRERVGDLDVTHWRAAADRQTGIYDVVSELSGDELEHLAEACCVDSQCLKRREWDEDAETDLDVPRGDGEFPCREPCSLFVSAARKITTLESESPREYTFELTPSEKNQVEAIVEAVADGRVDGVREADLNDPANRYRARYLTAKRLTDRGLADVPTFDQED